MKACGAVSVFIPKECSASACSVFSISKDSRLAFEPS